MRDKVKIACDKAAAQRQKDFEERCKKLWAFEKAKKERENKLFMERVVHEAHLIRKREEEEEEGKGAFLYTIEQCGSLWTPLCVKLLWTPLCVKLLWTPLCVLLIATNSIMCIGVLIYALCIF